DMNRSVVIAAPDWRSCGRAMGEYCLDERIETVTGEIEILSRSEAKCRQLMRQHPLYPTVAAAPRAPGRDPSRARGALIGQRRLQSRNRGPRIERPRRGRT